MPDPKDAPEPSAFETHTMTQEEVDALLNAPDSTTIHFDGTASVELETASGTVPIGAIYTAGFVTADDLRIMAEEALRVEAGDKSSATPISYAPLDPGQTDALGVPAAGVRRVHNQNIEQ